MIQLLTFKKRRHHIIRKLTLLRHNFRLAAALSMSCQLFNVSQTFLCFSAVLVLAACSLFLNNACLLAVINSHTPSRKNTTNSSIVYRVTISCLASADFAFLSGHRFDFSANDVTR